MVFVTWRKSHLNRFKGGIEDRQSLFPANYISFLVWLTLSFSQGTFNRASICVKMYVQLLLYTPYGCQAPWTLTFWKSPQDHKYNFCALWKEETLYYKVQRKAIWVYKDKNLHEGRIWKHLFQSRSSLMSVKISTICF